MLYHNNTKYSTRVYNSLLTAKSKKINIQIIILPIAVTLYMILMFIFPNASLIGAKYGLLLWFNTILPTLLPFIIISNLIVTLNISKYICLIFSPFLTRIFHVSKDGCYPIIIGLLSGFPVGAKTCADMANQKKITIPEAQFLVSLCNNVSYIFITSYIAVDKLSLERHQLYFFFIIYSSTVLSACIYREFDIKSRNVSAFTYPINDKSISFQSSKNKDSTIQNTETLTKNIPHPNNQIKDTKISTKSMKNKFDFYIIDEAILNGFVVITKIGGYIILFSILAKIISDIGTQNSLVKLLIVGILEITTGIDYISNSTLEIGKKIILILTITSFGGLSSIAQTKSVIANSRLSIKTYIKVKLLNALIAFILSICYVTFLF